MSDLTDKMVTAGVNAWENAPGENDRDFRACIAAALRVLEVEGYHLVNGPKHLYLDYVADEIEASS